MNKRIRIHYFLKKTTALGPGVRTAIWLQGCEKNCFGCMSPETKAIDGGYVVDIDRLIDLVLTVEGIEGVTISGGEPFLQIEALYYLLNEIRKNSNLSVIVYTGYTISQLKSMNNDLVDCMLNSLIDILIDGEYIERMNDGIALKGSSNQVVHFLSDKYINQKEIYNSENRRADIIISGTDALLVGIPEKEMLKTWYRIIDELNI